MSLGIGLIHQRQLRSFKCAFHRNGIMGAGFYHCSFDYLGMPLRAVVFAGDAPLGMPNGFCAVTDQRDIRFAFMGDDFEPAIRQAILAYGDRAFSDKPAKPLAASEPASATSPRSRT